MAISNKVANPTTGNGEAYGLLVEVLTMVWEMVRNSGGLPRWISPGDGWLYGLLAGI